MMQEFDALVKKRRELADWWNLRTEPTYNGGVHELTIEIHDRVEVRYHGQAYAGAKNYHEAPQFFMDRVKEEIRNSCTQFVSRAYEKEIARLDAEIAKHRAAILAELDAADKRDDEA